MNPLLKKFIMGVVLPFLSFIGALWFTLWLLVTFDALRIAIFR